MDPKILRESDPFGSRLVRSVTNGEQLIQYQLHLLTRYRPGHVLPCSLRSRNSGYQLCLDITGCSSIEQVLKAESIDPGLALEILKSIVAILQDAAEILLPADQFVLTVDSVFLKKGEVSSEALMMAYLPLQSSVKAEGQVGRSLAEIAAALGLPSDVCMGVANRFAEGGLPAMPAFFESIDHAPSGSLPNEKEKAMHGFAIIRPVLIKTRNRITTFLKAVYDWVTDAEKEQQPDFENQTVLLAANPDDYRMALLSEGLPGTPAENEGIRAFILTEVFLIGREIKTCDLCLSSPGIGRHHARITRRAGSFYIMDLGSRNGTRLNDQRLLKNTDTLLPDQCVIQFADQAFHFQVD